MTPLCVGRRSTLSAAHCRAQARPALNGCPQLPARVMNDQALDVSHSELRQFLAQSDFMRHGGVMTDLDGTAVHEENGRVYVSLPMESGLKRMHDLGRAVVINSLRFPLSIIRTFGKVWYQISGVPVPTVAMRGSMLGNMVLQPSGEI